MILLAAMIPFVARRPLPPGGRRLIFGAGNEELWVVLLLLVALIVLVVYLRRRNEDLFLLCLGYDRGPVLALLVLPLLALEVAVGVALRL